MKARGSEREQDLARDRNGEKEMKKDRLGVLKMELSYSAWAHLVTLFSVQLF